MKEYSEAAMERMMKIQDIILRAMAGRLKWFEAAEIIGISPRQMQRWRERTQVGRALKELGSRRYRHIHHRQEVEASEDSEPGKGDFHRTCGRLVSPPG